MARSPHGLPAQGLAAMRAYGQLGAASWERPVGSGQLGAASWRAASWRFAAGANSSGSGSDNRSAKFFLHLELKQQRPHIGGRGSGSAPGDYFGDLTTRSPGMLPVGA